jgi:hypothetical protein
MNYPEQSPRIIKRSLLRKRIYFQLDGQGIIPHYIK